MDFETALQRAGFARTEERPGRAVEAFSAHPNPYLTYWVHVYGDGTALFTWEFAITDYLLARGIQLGSSETLNTFAYPANDERGPQEAAWLEHVLEQTEAALSSVNLAHP